MSLATHQHPVTLLVRNIHCPSCVETVSALLEPLPVDNVQVSFLLRTVTFTVSDHSSGSDGRVRSRKQVVREVIDVLRGQGGFDVDDSEARSTAASGGGPGWASRLFDTVSRKQVLQRKREEERRRLHYEHCDACREGRELGSAHSTTSGEGEHSPDALMRTTVSIEGMTCASCTQSITSTLLSDSDVISVDINLLGHSGVIRHKASTPPDKVKELIEDVGFDAEVMSSTVEETSSKLKTILSIHGMTCASCSSAITHQLEGLEGVETINIDVLNNSGVIVHSSALSPDKIKENIEDVGFDADIVSTTAVGAEAETKEVRERTARIHVAGIFCGDCIEKLNQHLSTMPVQFTPFRLNNHTTQITYTPRQPYTIRDLLASLSQVSPEFDAELFKDVSLSDRSKEIQRKELKVLAAYWLVAFALSIPTFVVAIVGMILAPSSGSFRMMWMRPVWGAANIGTVVLWPLATIVQFGVGRLFYQRAFAPLHTKLRWLVKPFSRSDILRPSSPITWRSFFNFGNMDLLVVLSTTVSYFASLAMLIIDVRSPGADTVGTYFDSCVFLIMFILLGRVLEAYAKSRTTDAVSLLGKLRPERALLVEGPALERNASESDSSQAGQGKPQDTSTRNISVDLLEKDDIILVPPGSLPPTDGVVITGTTTFDESSLTGESRPIEKGPGDQVYSGTTNLSGAVTIRVTSVSGETMLEKIMTAVSDASGRKAPIEKLAERLTGVFVPVMVYLSLIVLAIWLSVTLTDSLPAGDDSTRRGGGKVFFAIEFAIATLVVACPCGIGLAIPCANAVGTGLAAKAGILASGGGEAFLAATQIDTVVLDKTGTLTVGESCVTDDAFWPNGSLEQATVGLMVRAVEAGSTHPLAQGIIRHFDTDDSQGTAQVRKTEEIRGRGLRATVEVEGQEVEILVGNQALVTEHGAVLSPEQEDTLRTWSEAAKSVVLVATKPTANTTFTLTAAYGLTDPLRETTAAALDTLRAMKLKIVMLTGDNESTAISVGKAAGIPSQDVRAGVGPEGKAEVIRELQGSTIDAPTKSVFSFFRRPVPTGRRVMFVGDGINDSVALAAADVSVAMGHGSQATMAGANFVLLLSSLAVLPTLLKLSRKVAQRQKLNLAWAIIFNIVCLPLAAGVFYPAGRTRLSPVWSAVVMACSSVSVVCSSLALRWGL